MIPRYKLIRTAYPKCYEIEPDSTGEYVRVADLIPLLEIEFGTFDEEEYEYAKLQLLSLLPKDAK